MSAEAFPPATRASLLHLTAYGGHQQAYEDLFCPMFSLAPSIGKIGPEIWLRLCRAKRVFFGTLDDDVWGFVAVALVRSMMGRYTAGLFLHPNSCLEPGVRSRIKYLLFSALCRVSRVSIISILPPDIMLGMNNVATHFVHDPQFWDQVDDPPSFDKAFKSQILKKADGRPILAYLGWATTEKGFPFLAKIVEASPLLVDELMIVAAGKINDNCQDAASQLSAGGVLVIDRFVSDEELATLYDIGAMIWVCYAPGYDQASGIFGRAVQSGRTPVIRETATTLGNYVRNLGIDAIALPQDPERAARLLVEARDRVFQSATPEKTLRKWKADFVAKIELALGPRQ